MKPSVLTQNNDWNVILTENLGTVVLHWKLWDFSHVSFWVASGNIADFGQEKHSAAVFTLLLTWKQMSGKLGKLNILQILKENERWKRPIKAIKIAVFPFFLKLPIQMCNFLCKYLGAITVIAQLMLSAFLWPFHASKMRNRIFHDFLGSLPYLATSIFPSLKRFKMTSLAICILSTMFEKYSNCRSFIF